MCPGLRHGSRRAIALLDRDHCRLAQPVKVFVAYDERGSFYANALVLP